MTEIPTVILTDDEHAECQEFIRLMTRSDEGDLVVKTEHAESFQRGLIALCLMGRAEKLFQSAGGSSIHVTLHIPYYSPELKIDQDLAEQAFVTASKACALFLLPIHFFDFGCMLYQIGDTNKARTMFKAFLDGVEKNQLDPIMQMWHAQRDIKSSEIMARELIS